MTKIYLEIMTTFMVEKNVEFIFIYKKDELILHHQNRRLCQTFDRIFLYI